MNRFVWLLRREWMQHHLGWLILAVVPLVLLLPVLPFATINIEGAPVGSTLGMLALSGYVYAVMALAAASVVFQSFGLARRDQQDRSIEFWLSLPTGHWQSILATVVMHVVLMPLLVLAISFVGGQVVAAAVVLKLQGGAALAQFASPSWWGFSLISLLRWVAGVFMAALWLAPVLLMGMASAAWLKRWGMPALVAAVAVAGLLIKQFTGQAIVWETLVGWFNESAVALMPMVRGGSTLDAAIKADSDLAWFSHWMWVDTGQLLRDAASPLFVAALAFGALGFGLLVLRRMRGA